MLSRGGDLNLVLHVAWSAAVATRPHHPLLNSARCELEVPRGPRAEPEPGLWLELTVHRPPLLVPFFTRSLAEVC